MTALTAPQHSLIEDTLANIAELETFLPHARRSDEIVILAAIAQARATAAVAEQVRIANLAALYAVGNDDARAALHINHAVGDELRPGIAAALGITT